jgi:hypothetical protein
VELPIDKHAATQVAGVEKRQIPSRQAGYLRAH